MKPMDKDVKSISLGCAIDENKYLILRLLFIRFKE